MSIVGKSVSLRHRMRHQPTRLDFEYPSQNGLPTFLFTVVLHISTLIIAYNSVTAPASNLIPECHNLRRLDKKPCCTAAISTPRRHRAAKRANPKQSRDKYLLRPLRRSPRRQSLSKNPHASLPPPSQTHPQPPQHHPTPLPPAPPAPSPLQTHRSPTSKPAPHPSPHNPPTSPRRRPHHRQHTLLLPVLVPRLVLPDEQCLLHHERDGAVHVSVLERGWQQQQRAERSGVGEYVEGGAGLGEGDGGCLLVISIYLPTCLSKALGSLGGRGRGGRREEGLMSAAVIGLRRTLKESPSSVS